MSDMKTTDPVTSSTRLTNEGATSDMDRPSFSWPTVVLILGIAIPTLGADVFLALKDKPTEAILTTVLALLTGFGVVQHTSTQKDLGKIQEQGKIVVDQTNGRMTAMQDQVDRLIGIVTDLALRVPPPTDPPKAPDDPHI